MAKIVGKTQAQRNTELLIKVQQIAATALRLNNNSRTDAIAWLQRDYDRHIEDRPPLPIGEEEHKETLAMKCIRESIDYLTSHPSWDGQVQYELLGGAR